MYGKLVLLPNCEQETVLKQRRRFEVRLVQGQREQKHLERATTKLVEQGLRLAFDELEL